ncbi:hypothetical protein HPB50_004860 [Hyalomma asiaticum]|uniref:Uncharacterized protein n=1 Tax=Hyalomma asiaticum TaxID=266040 RepID=A0ACB7SE30_HYAAI|nr:hypothetical protein HPB50_004860 [Hyalomma asiaticum]
MDNSALPLCPGPKAVPRGYSSVIDDSVFIATPDPPLAHRAGSATGDADRSGGLPPVLSHGSTTRAAFRCPKGIWGTVFITIFLYLAGLAAFAMVIAICTYLHQCRSKSVMAILGIGVVTMLAAVWNICRITVRVISLPK